MARNTPYAGGHATMQYGRVPAVELHALQIEINRGLYLDEDKITKKAAFEAVKNRVTDALAALTCISPTLLQRARPEAADGFSRIRRGLPQGFWPFGRHETPFARRILGPEQGAPSDVD